MKANTFVKIATTGVLLTALLAVVALQPATVQAASTTKNVSANFKGMLSKPAAGECATGYAHQCPSTVCFNSTPVGTPTISGTFGKGTITGMCVTIDAGDAVTSNGGNTCAPFYGDMVVHVSVTKGGVTTVTDTALNINGAYCRRQPNSTLDAIEGGFGIDGALSTDTSENGWGTATGTSDHDTGVTLIKIKGNATP